MELKRDEIIKELEGLANFLTCPDYITNALALIKELIEENERLRAENVDCKLGFSLLEDAFQRLEKINNQIEAETVRKMQERLQAYFGTYVLGYKIPLSEAIKAVNQIAKEMLEDINEQ